MSASSSGRFLAIGLAGLLASGAPSAQERDDVPETGAWTIRPGLESHRDRLADERTLTPAGTGLAQREWSQVDMRMWATRGRQSLGIGLGAVTNATLAPATGQDPARLIGQQVGPALTVGWRARFGEDTTLYADTSTMPGRLVGDADNRPYFSTRGGVDWKLSESKFGFDRGRLSMRLDSGYRMSLRLRSGGVGFMLRGQF